MAKKPAPKQQQLLSPENYIRQKARNLPIYECKINITWEKEKFSQITVCRQHANGNFTVCFYLVDLGCLGVKDSGFRFNIDKYEYDELLQKMDETDPIMSVDYTLVHNIIFSGLAYAEDLGFKACKEFLQTTQFMLEEDTDDVELIEIECGVDGKPMYINSGFDSAIREKQIINQLEKAVGKGNFKFMLDIDNYDSDDIEDEDDEFLTDDDKLYRQYKDVEIDELQAEFIELTESITNIESEEAKFNAKKLNVILDELCIRLCDNDLVDNYIEDWLNDARDKHVNENDAAKMLGLENVHDIPEDVDKLIHNFFNDLGKSESKATKDLQKIEKITGKTAFTAYLELNILREFDLKNYGAKLDKYGLQYPDFGLIRLLKHVYNQKNNESNLELPTIKNIYSSNTSITSFEFYEFLISMSTLILSKNDLNLLEAFDAFINEISLPDSIYDNLRAIYFISRMTLVLEKLKINTDGEPIEPKLKIYRPNSESNMAFQFKVQLADITKPPVWRRLIVADNTTFEDFHNILQDAFGWDNYHLFNFSPMGWGSKPEIAVPHDDDYEQVTDATTTELKDIFNTVGQKFTYMYDFGDDWRHKIELEEIHSNYHGQVPACLDGKGCCPPEDCGGVGGYEHLKQVLANPKDHEYKDMLSWLGLRKGSDWDVNEFNLNEVNEILSEF
jgi:hypothetical protein